MPMQRFPIRDIKGFTPATEARSSQETFVLDGKNFFFDSKGPKSGFGSRLLGNGSIIEQPEGIVQSLDARDQSFVFTTAAVRLLSLSENIWNTAYDLTVHGDKESAWSKRWTTAYLSSGVYFCHPDFGFFKLQSGILVPKDTDDIPGFPDGPLAIAETNGRLLVLNRTHVSWSAPVNAENFTPEIGGAGFQLLSERVAGRPVALSAFQTGFLVWTDEDCLTAEFVGGVNVFRFDRMTTEQLPLEAWAIEDMPDGSQLICTNRGIHQTANGQEPQSIVPVFNEFFRQVLTKEDFRQVRLTFSVELDQLFVQLRDYTNHYVRTYVLNVSLDKWGTFDERHLGIIRYKPERGAWGYVDQHGVAHKFVEFAPDKETTNEEVPFVNLDSHITFGYIKPPDMHLGFVDSLLEMQEILLGGFPIRPEDDVAHVIELGPIELTPSPICLDFQTPLYILEGIEHEPTALFANYNAAYLLGVEGYGLGPSFQENLNSDGDYIESTTNLYFNEFCGFTYVVEIDLGDDPNLSGTLLYFHELVVDGGRIELTLDRATGTVELDTDFAGTLLSVSQALGEVMRVAVCFSRELASGDYRTSLSVDGGTADTVDLLSGEPFARFATNGFTVGIGGAPGSVGQGSDMSADCGIQRLCIFGPVDEVTLAEITLNGNMEDLWGYGDLEELGFSEICNPDPANVRYEKVRAETFDFGGFCGTGAQVPSGTFNKYTIPAGSVNISFGLSSFGGTRMTLQEIWQGPALEDPIIPAPRLYKCPVA